MFDIGLVVNRQLHIIRVKTTPSTIYKRRNSVLILAGKSCNMAVRVAKHLVLAGFPSCLEQKQLPSRLPTSGWDYKIDKLSETQPELCFYLSYTSLCT